MCIKMQIQMKETDFYNMLEITEQMEAYDGTNYYPTVEDIKEYESDIKKHLPMLFFFANDPYRDINVENKSEYNRMVKYVKELIAGIKLI